MSEWEVVVESSNYLLQHVLHFHIDIVQVVLGFINFMIQFFQHVGLSPQFLHHHHSMNIE